MGSLNNFRWALGFMSGPRLSRSWSCIELGQRKYLVVVCDFDKGDGLQYGSGLVNIKGILKGERFTVSRQSFQGGGPNC